MDELKAAIKEYLRLAEETNSHFDKLDLAYQKVVDASKKIDTPHPLTTGPNNPFCERCIKNILTDAQVAFCKREGLPPLCFSCQRKNDLKEVRS